MSEKVICKVAFPSTVDPEQQTNAALTISIKEFLQRYYRNTYNTFNAVNISCPTPAPPPTPEPTLAPTPAPTPAPATPAPEQTVSATLPPVQPTASGTLSRTISQSTAIMTTTISGSLPGPSSLSMTQPVATVTQSISATTTGVARSALRAAPTSTISTTLTSGTAATVSATQVVPPISGSVTLSQPQPAVSETLTASHTMSLPQPSVTATIVQSMTMSHHPPSPSLSMSLNPPVSDEDVCFYLSGIHNATASSLLEQALGKNETKTELLSALGADDLTCEFPAPPNSDTGSNASLPVYIGAAVGGCLLLIGMIAAFLLIGRGKLSRSNRTASRINEKTLHQSLMHVPGEEEMSKEEEEREMDTMHWFSPPPPPSDTPFAPPTNPILPSMNV